MQTIQEPDKEYHRADADMWRPTATNISIVDKVVLFGAEARGVSTEVVTIHLSFATAM